MGRRYFEESKDKNDKETSEEYARTILVAEIENTIEASKIRLQAAEDRQVSISSANPNQIIFNPPNNSGERQNIVSNIRQQTVLMETVKGSHI
jgi:hypothetical protein